MRRSVAFALMALGIMVTGTAWAHDATQVIYDLSALRTQQFATPASSPLPQYAVLTSRLPISTPSLSAQPADSPDPGVGDLEITPRPHGPLQGTGAGSPRTGGKDDNPSPTPEPGTMLLLGSALASGARFMRRRSKA